MKKRWIVLASVLLAATVAHAQLRIAQLDTGMGIDTSDFPPQMREAYDLMTVKCTKCHSIERIIVAVQTGVTPITKGSLTKKDTEHLVVRMFLKPEAEMTKGEARDIMLLLNYLLDLKSSMPVETREQPGAQPVAPP